MEDDNHATNVRMPSPEQGFGPEPLKTKSEDSVNSARQRPGTYNLRCETCNRVLATNLETEKQAEEIIDQHIEGKACESFKTDLVKPQEPLGEN